MAGILRRAEEAESLISQAVARNDFATALDACILSADLYLQSFKSCIVPAEKQRQREKFMQLLQRGDELKKLKAQPPTLSRQASGVDRVTTAVANVTLAEASTPRRTPIPNQPRRLPPLSQRNLTKAEQIILLSASKLTPHTFPPWDEKAGPADSDFIPTATDELFTDPSGPLTLSPEQQKHFDRWYRPREAWRGSENMVLVRDGEDLAADLSQDIISDCSVVASFCTAFTREQKGHGNLISCTLWPQSNGAPIVSQSGKYIVRLWFNGCYRKVIIDDFLPGSPEESEHALHVVSNGDPSFILPSLLEKAYLKAMGGYDFPGSNSGTDLYCFTGWIPEHLFLKGNPADLSLERADPVALWDRVYQKWLDGDVLITLGTGALEQGEGRGLVGEHDYAIIGLQEVVRDNGKVGRWLLVKNPWKTGGNWSGPPFMDDDDDEDEDDDKDDVDDDEDDDIDNPKRKKSGDDDSDDDDEDDDYEDEYPEELAQVTSRSAFWIDLNSVFRYFDSIYLNWNPALWNHRYDWHFSWPQLSSITKLAATEHLWNVPGCFWGNPQYKLVNNSSAATKVWILLSRHLVRNKSYRNKDIWNKAGHISLYLFAANGKRVYHSSGYLKRGPYVDSPQTLLRIELPPKTAYTVVVSSQDLLPQESSHGFSISAFTSIPVVFEAVDEPYPYVAAIQSSWNISATGGNTESREYGRNPMVKINLLQQTSLIIGLSVHAKPTANGKAVAKAIAKEKSSSPLIHVSLLHSDGGRRVYTLTRNKFLAHSGEYKRFFTTCFAENVPRGAYTIVASTYTSDRYAPFTITVGSSTPLSPATDLSVIPNEDAGLHSAYSRCRLSAKTCSIRLFMTRLSSGKIRVVKKSTGEYLRVGVWENGTKKWAAGGWSDDGVGGDEGFVEGVARLDDVDLRPDREVGETWLVVDSMINEECNVQNGKDSKSGSSGFEVTILSDHGVKFHGDWLETSS